MTYGGMRKKPDRRYHFKESEFVITGAYEDSWYPEYIFSLYYDTVTGETDIMGRRSWKKVVQ